MKGKWAGLLVIFLLVGCNAISKKDKMSNESIQNPESPSATIEEIRLPTASGTLTQSDGLVLIDYSNTDQGYIQAKTLSSDHQRLKIQIMNNEVKYNYDLNLDYEYETFPLNMGEGAYTITAFEHVSDNRYTPLFKIEVNVVFEQKNLPWLYPSQIVDYDQTCEAVIKSFELTAGDKTELDRVKSIYDYVTENIDYDWDKVEEVQGNYVLPVLDETLSSGKGICFDYAALMAAMLRVQNIPTKVITGDVEEGYHAWVEVYIHNMGWIAPHIYFEEETWTRIDPTFDAIGSNYRGKYETKYEY